MQQADCCLRALTVAGCKRHSQSNSAEYEGRWERERERVGSNSKSMAKVLGNEATACVETHTGFTCSTCTTRGIISC